MYHEINALGIPLLMLAPSVDILTTNKYLMLRVWSVGPQHYFVVIVHCKNCKVYTICKI